MTVQSVPATALIDAFAARAGTAFAARLAGPADLDWLQSLFTECMRESHARIVGPEIADRVTAMLASQQFALRRRAFASDYPGFTELILLRADGLMIGAFCWMAVLDGNAHIVDIAVLPDQRVGSPGRLMLQAWLDVTDRQGLTTSLYVEPTNPARLTYERLGYGVTDPAAMPLHMTRSAQPCPPCQLG
ncbi:MULTISPECIES: GNAT family N-acetyltransferase [unclassified Azospirillum]|uniref:GNAT family N-acetyltransferase n=1 Tax=unclassified Azospirillum TaxID=2630922 RepID=UPI000B69BF53|nr:MULTISPECIES: GNAT family N-acetyltransferase [unclassified Azospirillum]SNT18158.1 Acetyltransferase (GNAT) family protein [Azospirillum sp. RU38E]SNT30199.1 Acetyltransferase (GNAT) family protein [Azospirillum sp. RU37A]